VATLESWLQSHGFGSVKLNPGRQTLEFSGSAAQFRNTFHAEIHKYQANGEAHYANATDSRRALLGRRRLQLPQQLPRQALQQDPGPRRV
jgi:hypothetical protein